MKQNTILAAASLLALTVCGQAQTTEEPKCSNEMLKGTYGVMVTGTRPAPFIPSGKPGYVGQFEQVIGVVVLVFDGKGNYTQVDNIKGTVSGFPPDRPGKGTYVVNADCLVISTLPIAPGVTIINRGVLLDGGKEYRGFTVSPEEVNVVSIGRKVH